MLKSGIRNKGLPMRFTTQSMQEILPLLQNALKTQTTITFEVLNPDLAAHAYAGKNIQIENTHYIYRGYKAWVNLAELLMCKMHTPKEAEYPLITLIFEKLRKQKITTSKVKMPYYQEF